MYTSTTRSNQEQTHPFQPVVTYPTGWAGERTFAQIMDDCTPLAATLIRKHGIAYQDFPDALQRGFMVVWERLVQDTQMFAHADKYAVVRIVEANCGMNYWRRHDRHLSLDALAGIITEDHPDEWMVTGLEANRSELWAAWATATDLRITFDHRDGFAVLDRLHRRPFPPGTGADDQNVVFPIHALLRRDKSLTDTCSLFDESPRSQTRRSEL